MAVALFLEGFHEAVGCRLSTFPMPSPTASPTPRPNLLSMPALRITTLVLLLAFAAAASAQALYATSIRTRLGPDAPIECNLYTVDPATARASFVAPLKAQG